MAPLLLGIAPFGMVIGVTVADRDIPAAAGLSTGLLIYAGSAQLAAIELLAGGAAPVVLVATVLAVNARLLLYSSAMAAHWRGTSRAWRIVAAYLLVDPSFGVGVDGYQKHGRTLAGHAHYLGGACLLWIVWQLAIVAGMTLGTAVPESLGLDFVVPLYLVAMVVPKATTRPVRVAAVVGALAAFAGNALPFHLGPAAGILAGVAVGLWLGRKTR